MENERRFWITLDTALGRMTVLWREIVDLDSCSRFQQHVLLEESRIPRGKVSTYGRIASRLGIPKGARAVGRALGTNRFPLVVPCHRAVRSDGAVGGFQG